MPQPRVLIVVAVLTVLVTQVPVLAQVYGEGWFVYMNGRQTFAGPFNDAPGCRLLSNYLNDRFEDFFACRYSDYDGVDDSATVAWWVERTILSRGTTDTFAGPFEMRSDCLDVAVFLNRNFTNAFGCRYY